MKAYNNGMLIQLLNRNSMAVCFICPFLATKIRLILALPPIVSVVIVLPSSHSDHGCNKYMKMYCSFIRKTSLSISYRNVSSKTFIDSSNFTFDPGTIQCYNILIFISCCTWDPCICTYSLSVFQCHSGLYYCVAHNDCVSV